ncbi:MAG: PEP-CTERM sorting domain-containing protein [Fimbriimonadaceae bacterium]|nr:PEP-CTERM sorting domain-containing protein [Fimbriimonadaceae bacterium]
MNTNRFLTGVVAALAASSALATNWVWDWDGGTAYNNMGGRINSIHAEYNDATNRMVWKTNFGKNPDGKRTDGFSLIVTPGPKPRGDRGQYAAFYFDRSGGGSGNNPALTVYAYNGKNNDDSWKDGSNASGTQAPDRILSSKLTQNWINALNVVTEANGSRTFTMDIDATAIRNHVPAYPGSDPWTGSSFGPRLGLWMQPVVGISSAYSDGYLCDWQYKDQGCLEGANFCAVPEPGTIIALGAGIAALATRRRRK